MNASPGNAATPAPCPRRRVWRRLVGAAIVAVLAFVVAFRPAWVGWPLGWRINAFAVDVDLYSGRKRHTRYVLYIPVRRTTVETPFSLALTDEETPSAPFWILDGLHQAGTRFCTPLSNYLGWHIRQIAEAWDALPAGLEPDARAKIARQGLYAWREGGGWSGTRYREALLDLFRAFGEADGKLRPLAAADVPDDLAERAVEEVLRTWPEYRSTLPVPP